MQALRSREAAAAEVAEAAAAALIAEEERDKQLAATKVGLGT